MNTRKPFLSGRSGVLGLVLLLAGCGSLAPDYAPPRLDLPPEAAIEVGKNAGNATSAAPWWRQDAALAALIDEALANNADLLVAAARIEQARAALGLARAEQGPAAGLAAGAKRSKDPTMGQPTGNRFDAQLALSWELDFWGKYRDASAAAREQLFAAEAGREALRLSLAGELARTWYTLLADRQRLALVEKTLAAQTREQDLLRRRVAAGIVGDFELRQHEAELAATQVLREQLRAALDREKNALGLLLGRSPKALAGALPPENAPAPLFGPDPLPAGLPSSRLLRRPDVRAAEAQLKAAHWQIGAARAAWFPALSLTASGGVASRELSSLFESSSGIFSLGAGLLQPLLFSGRIAAGIDAAEAGREVAAQVYRQTVARAFREALDALTARHAAQEIAKAETARVGALDETLRLARRRYQGGLISQFELLASERALLAAQAGLIDAQRAEAAAAVTVWAALGG